MQRPISISNEEEWRVACRAIVNTARAILTNELGIIEGARRLCAYRFKVKAENDEDFRFFLGLESETDHLPTGEVEKHWNPAVLEIKGEEIFRIENFYREKALLACKKLIEKYHFEKEEI